MSGAELFLGKRSWDEQVADLQQFWWTSLLGRSGHRVSDSRGVSRPGLRQKHRFFHAVMACPGISSCLPWLAYTLLPNVDLDKGLFGFSFSPLKKIVRKYFSWNKGAFSNEDPCTVKPNHDTMADVVSSSVEEPVSQTT